MKLDEYINSFPKEKRMLIRNSIAENLGISEVYVRSMCNGNKKIPEKWAVALETATGGFVKREEICPHLFIKNIDINITKSISNLKLTDA